MIRESSESSMEALRSPDTVLNGTRERCSLPNALMKEPFIPEYSTMIGDDLGREETRRKASMHCARPDATSLGDDANWERIFN